MESTLADTRILIKKIAGWCGIIQGTAWEIMSIISIILYVKGPSNFEPIPESYMEYINRVITNMFLNYSGEAFPNQILTGSVFHGFMWTHLFTNIIWIIFSALLLRKKQTNESKVFIQWSYATFLVCFLDFITVVILGADYGKCYRKAKEMGYMALSYEGICVNGIITVLVIAARGFVLWGINLVLAFAMYRIGRHLKS
ncbi:uncharacterized protein LOC123015555 [Tribolium madens]|uniref:uncharacterized protein LOC123015555 n=1 Tax=Tribolium madens TaxID=41895 RepID=UPI001CF7671A|nr:uncharacterized protein LOC123015555 [Tribolium madens]